MKLISFNQITENTDSTLEQKAEHIWKLINAAQKAGIKTYVCLPNYTEN
jgi:hypothetical protein